MARFTSRIKSLLKGFFQKDEKPFKKGGRPVKTLEKAKLELRFEISPNTLSFGLNVFFRVARKTVLARSIFMQCNLKD